MRRTHPGGRGIRVHPYLAALFVGATTGVTVAAAIAPAHGLAPARVRLALLLLLAPGLLGARALFVARHWETFRADRARIWRRAEGGMAVYGGLLLVLATSVPLLRALALPLAPFWDAAAVAILAGLACTKVGCHLNGCCAGRRSDGWLALRLPDERGVVARRLPAQLLEGAFAAALGAVALAVHRALPFDGALFLGAVLAYGAGRLVLESTRQKIDRVGRVGLNHLLSASLAGAAAVAMAAAWLAR